MLKKVTAIILAAAMTLTIPVIAAPEAEAAPLICDKISLSGGNRYETAACTACEAFPNGAETAIIVTGKNFPDALAANALAGALDAPVLLSSTSQLSGATARLLGETWSGLVSHLVVIGLGFEERFYEDLTALGFSSEMITQLGGDNRYETAVDVCRTGLDAGYFSEDTVIVATGRTAADALAVSPWSYRLKYPVLLAGSGGRVSESTASLIRRFGRVILLGASNVVADGAACGRPFVRLGGSNRYLTAGLIAEFFVKETGGSYDNTGFADGTDAHFPDALTAGMLLGKYGAPILLTNNRQFDTRAFIFTTLKNDPAVRRLYFFGYAAEGCGPAYDRISRYLEAEDWVDIRTAGAGTVLTDEQVDDSDLGYYFVSYTITPGDAVYRRIVNKSYDPKGLIALSDLRYLKVLHINFDGKIQVGEMICHAEAAPVFLKVFRELYQNRYQIRQMRLIDDFWAGNGLDSDFASIEADNTSCFCYRQASNAANLSNHAWGRAIDLNPLENPYVYVTPNGSYSEHSASAPYVTNRDPSIPHVITTSDTAYRILTAYGFTWGGHFSPDKDYQHFDYRG